MRKLSLLLLCALMLVACGKKPNFVEAPEGSGAPDRAKNDGTHYPRTYPEPWL